MSLSAAEKLEVIRMVEESELPVKRTLAELGVSRSSFYRWYQYYLDDGPEGLEPGSRSPRRFWNRLPECVFHGKAATDYTAKLPPISHESCHPLHGKAATPKEVDNRRV